jgi:hypothetical protein
MTIDGKGNNRSGAISSNEVGMVSRRKQRRSFFHIWGMR